jgi:hypothetical protein
LGTPSFQALSSHFQNVRQIYDIDLVVPSLFA